MKRLMIYIGLHNEEVSTATTHILQNIIKTVTNVDEVRKEREKYEAERVKNPAARMRAWPFLSDKIGESMIVYDTPDRLISPLASFSKVYCLMVKAVHR